MRSTRRAYKKQYYWSREIAYLVGLLTADGCLVNDERHINITSKDMQVIEVFQQILGIKTKVGKKLGGYNTESYYLQFSDVAFYDFLLGIGLTPAKSKTIAALLVPDLYYGDFLRGYFDGDGTIYGFWDRRWKSSLMYYVDFFSASLPFLLWVQDNNSRIQGVTRGAIKPGVRCYKLSYSKKDSQKLFRLMYSNEGIDYKLDRKYEKFVAFLGADPYAN
jgi:hypothetical protein